MTAMTLWVRPCRVLAPPHPLQHRHPPQLPQRDTQGPEQLRMDRTAACGQHPSGVCWSDLRPQTLCSPPRGKDTVSKQRQDDEVKGREHAFADAALRLDPVIHHCVPVLSRQDLRRASTTDTPAGPPRHARTLRYTSPHVIPYTRTRTLPQHTCSQGPWAHVHAHAQPDACGRGSPRRERLPRPFLQKSFRKDPAANWVGPQQGDLLSQSMAARLSAATWKGRAGQNTAGGARRGPSCELRNQAAGREPAVTASQPGHRGSGRARSSGLCPPLPATWAGAAAILAP